MRDVLLSPAALGIRVCYAYPLTFCQIVSDFRRPFPLSYVENA